MKVVLLLVSLLAVIGGYYAFGREYNVAYFSRSPDYSIFENLSSDAAVIRLPFSSRGMRELFAACGDTQQGIIYALQPKAVQRQVDGNCRGLAQLALLKNPTYGAAHTIKMLSSVEPQEIRAETVFSQKTSAYESAQAKLRLAKSIAFVGTGDTDFDAALRDDVIFLVQSDGGRTWLANLYGRIPTAQNFLTQILEARPSAEKADFLQKVRADG